MHNRNDHNQIHASELTLPIEEYLQATEGMLTASEAVLKKHCGYKEHMAPHMEKIQHAYQHVHGLLGSKHHDRSEFDVPQGLSIEYYKTMREMHLTERSISRINSGKRLRYWEHKLEKYEARLAKAKSGSCEEIKAVAKLYLGANQALRNLQGRHDDLSIFAVSERRELFDAVMTQRRVVEILEAQLTCLLYNPKVMALEEKILHIQSQVEKYTLSQ